MNLRRPVLVLGLAIAVSACAHANTPPPDVRAQAVVAWRDVTQCYRDQTSPIPDAQIDDQSNATFPADVPRVPQDLIAACRQYLDRLPNRNANSGPTAADVARRRQFASCMRGHGVTAWPDPDAEGRFPNTPALEAEAKSPTLIAAQNACQHYLTDGG